MPATWKAIEESQTNGDVMNAKELLLLKEALLRWKEELLEGAIQLSQKGQLDPGQTSDPTDRAQIEDGRIPILRIKDRERKLIKKIDEALERFETGTFGLCIHCGQEIGIERLKARPVTDLCIECKAEQEFNERP